MYIRFTAPHEADESCAVYFEKNGHSLKLNVYPDGDHTWVQITSDGVSSSGEFYDNELFGLLEKFK
jgi:hypothetical protein